MNITDTRISFTRNLKAAVFEEEADHTIKTFFRCTESALQEIHHVWMVEYNGELIAVSKQEAKALGYTDCDETLIAVNDDHGEFPGFRWEKPTENQLEEAMRQVEELRRSGIIR